MYIQREIKGSEIEEYSFKKKKEDALLMSIRSPFERSKIKSGKEKKN